MLGGTRENPRLHRLNGPVSTPLFDHLGSSSWHSFDAAMIVWFGRIKAGRWIVPALVVVVALVLVRLRLRPWLKQWLKQRRLQRAQLAVEKMNNV